MMDPRGTPKITFMSNNKNYYYYNVIPFGLQNIGAIIQRLMGAFFIHQIGENLKVYVDNMIFKMEEGHKHADNLEDILQSVRNYDMCLNPNYVKLSTCLYVLSSANYPSGRWSFVALMMTGPNVK